MKNLYCLILFAVIFPLTGNCQEVRYSNKVESRIKQVENNLVSWVQTGTDDRWNIIDRMKKYGVNGVSIAVIHDYKIEWAKGYGLADVSENRPVTEKTLFQAASISKSLNSLGVLKLAEKGLINCDSDVNIYLKSWKFPYDAKTNGKKITVKELLSHTAGLTIHGFPGYRRGNELPTLVQVLNGEKPSNTKAIRSFEEPGKSLTYSGGGISISQLLVSDVTGQSYESYMQKEVLDPLGMTSSCYCQPPDGLKADLLATAYKADGKEVPGKYHVYPEKAAAGLWTNPTDLCRYILETEFALKGSSSKVLSESMTRYRLTPVKGEAALGSFITVRVPGSYRYFNHSGGNEGFLCMSWGCLDSGEGMVVMINSENFAIIEEIVNSVATVYKWKDFYLPENKKPIDLKPELVTKYTGKYQIFFNTYEIVPFESGLGVKQTGASSFWKLYFTSDSDFFTKENRGTFTFRFTPEGKVKGFVTGGTLAKRKE